MMVTHSLSSVRRDPKPRRQPGRLVRSARRWLGPLALMLASLAVWGRRASAQINPSHTWYSLHTQHFIVPFTRPLEPLARRLAGHAERAYAELSRELHPPRGMIDLVVTDDAD